MNFDTLLQKHNETNESPFPWTPATWLRFSASTNWWTCPPPLFSRILQNPLLLSDSCLHLFLQSQLSVSKMEACAAGRTRYSVAQAVQGCGLRRFHSEEDLQKDLSMSCDSDSDRFVTLFLFLLKVFQSNWKSLPCKDRVHLCFYFWWFLSHVFFPTQNNERTQLLN